VHFRLQLRNVIDVALDDVYDWDVISGIPLESIGFRFVSYKTLPERSTTMGRLKLK
jgi:hypothetical protein